MFFCATAVQTFYHFIPEKYLYGYERDAPKPFFSYQTWLDGSFQKNTDKWLSQHIGFRSYIIKTENQLNLDIFHEISSYAIWKVILGKDGHLFLRSSVAEYRKENVVPNSILKGEVVKIRKVQDFLTAHGKTFLLVIMPDSGSYYPEYLPDAYKRNLPIGIKNNHDVLVALLKQEKINLFDVQDYFASQKNNTPYPLMVRGSSHWSYYGACRASNEIISVLERQMKKQMSHIACDPTPGNARHEVSDINVDVDRDLEEVISIWGSRLFAERAAHPSYEVIKKKNAFRPSILIVGASFANFFSYSLKTPDIISSFVLYKWYTIMKHDNKGAFRPINKSAINWNEDFFSKDIVILDVSRDVYDDIGFGFIDDALHQIELRNMMH